MSVADVLAAVSEMSGLGSDGQTTDGEPSESAPKRQKFYCINVIAYDEEGGDILCNDEISGNSQLCKFCSQHIGGGVWGN